MESAEGCVCFRGEDHSSYGKKIKCPNFTDSRPSDNEILRTLRAFRYRFGLGHALEFR